MPLRFTDWAVTPKFGEEIAIDMPYRHNGGGDTSPRVMIFTQRIPLAAGKQPDTLTLPVDPKLHVFAVSGVREEAQPPCDQPERSDEFNDSELLDNCHWTVRRPDETAYDVSDGALHLTARPGEYNDTANIITQDGTRRRVDGDDQAHLGPDRGRASRPGSWSPAAAAPGSRS